MTESERWHPAFLCSDLTNKMEDMKQALGELEREVTCAVCLQQYTEPKVLPCLHYYCKLCVVKMVAKRNPLSCPDCRKETKIGAGKEDELPTAHFINRLKELHAKQKKALSKNVFCEICSKHRIQAKSFCKQCQKFICKRCVESHALMASLFEGHELISIEDFEKLSQEEVFSKNSTKKKCRVHDKTLKIFCYQCEALICRDCIIIDHRDHKIQFNDVAANKKREDLKENLISLTQIETELSAAVKNIERATKEIIDQGVDLASEIESSFMKLQRILDSRKRELLIELHEKVECKLEALKKQNTGLGEARAGINRVVNYTEQCVQHCSDIDIMEMHKDLSHRIQQNVDSSDRLKASSSPVESASLRVEFNCASPLQALCNTKATLAEVDECNDLFRLELPPSDVVDIPRSMLYVEEEELFMSHLVSSDVILPVCSLPYEAPSDALLRPSLTSIATAQELSSVHAQPMSSLSSKCGGSTDDEIPLRRGLGRKPSLRHPPSSAGAALPNYSMF